VQRESLDEEGKRIWDELAGTGKSIPRTGPSAGTMHSPKAAEPIDALNQGDAEDGGRPQVLRAGRARRRAGSNQQYEWSAHEPAGLKAGLDQSVIDAVKYDRDLAGLPDKDPTVIRLGP
jgi:4-carboxymuconolactone decarboxylase